MAPQKVFVEEEMTVSMKQTSIEEKGRRHHRRFFGTRVIVVGDIMVDHFIWGKVSRISPEAPVPVVEVARESQMLGGSANVLNNIIAAGGNALYCGCRGKRPDGPLAC